MRKLFKRAFTLVELLVVIAILGVLATVSIVGYSSYTKRANLQADSTLVSEWNHLLLAEDNINEIDNVNEAKELFISHNTNEDTFVPKSNNYHFYYNTTYNNVFLVDDSNGFSVSYPTDNTITTANSYRLDKTYVLIDCDITDTSIDKNAIEKGVNNTITFNGTIPATVMIGSTAYKVEDSKLTVNSNSDVEIVQDPTVYVTSIEINKTQSDITCLETDQLTITINPNNATTQTVKWESNNTNVATVDGNGLVTTYNVGTAVITATVKDLCGTYTKTCNITVTPIKVNEPSVTGTYTYTGEEKTVILSGVENYMTTSDSLEQTNAGDYNITYTLTSANYEWAEDNDGIVTWTINKAQVTKPTENNESFVYTGNEQKYELTTNSLYTISNDIMTDVGSQTVTVALNDKDNYEWNDDTNVDLEFTFTIAKATAVISDLNITGWTFGDAANTPSASSNFGAIAYSYCDTENGEYSSNVPTNAGTYYVKASVANDDNYNGAESKRSFVINQVTEEITDIHVTFNTDIIISYSTKGQNTKPSVTYEYKSKSDVAFSTEAPTANGTYILRITIGETTNYTSATAEYEFTINN